MTAPSPTLACQAFRLSERHLESVISLFAEVIEDMEAAGIHQWDEYYPDRDILAADLAAGHAFGLFEGDTLVAYVALNEDEPEEYGTVVWACSGCRRLVVHRLCVKPSCRGRGYAKKLMAFTERLALDHGRASVRLDAFIPNRSAIALYEGLGYALRGRVRFRKGEFNCYEKELG